MMKKLCALLLCAAMLAGCTAFAETAAVSDRETVEAALDLSRSADQTWTYVQDADAWVLSVTPYVTRPVLADCQGVSVSVPGAYVAGIDTDGDGTADVTAADASGAVCGSLVIDPEGSVTSSNGQVYTAATAPVLFETGGAGYSAQQNRTAGTSYAAEGYVYMSAGNRGKQSSYTDGSGAVVYTGDAPDMIVDGKAAIRFVKYNIALGNLPGDADRFVVTGGSGAGAHTIMLALTGNAPVYYDYLEALGAAGVYRLTDGTWDVTVSDAVWGAAAYSPITSLAEADTALAFEYTLDAAYAFSTPFQKQMAACLAQEYMDLVNSRGMTADEAALDLDIDGDGEKTSVVALTIEYDPEACPETNGYHGTYVDLYTAQFEASLQAYLDRLAYAEGWTWFNADGTAMSDAEVAAMTDTDRAAAFLEGRAAVSGGRGAAGGMGRMGGRGGMGRTGGGRPDGAGGPPDMGTPPDMGGTGTLPDMGGMVGTPDAGTTQAAGSTADSANYATYDEMLAAYQADVAEVHAGDEFGNDQVALYDPYAFITAEGTELPAWVRIMNGAAEGDISMLNSLNLTVALSGAGVDTSLEWQWNGGHVPGETLGDSLSLRIDEKFGAYTEGAVQVTKAAAVPATANGTAEAATVSDVTSWVTLDADGKVSFTAAAAAAYRTAGASKAMPAFDVIDYGQEDYVFGSDTADARHWDGTVLRVLTEHRDVLEPLFNAQ